jgi:hypothetical protein
MLAWELRTSIDCARVMRGTSSIATPLTLRRHKASTIAGQPSGDSSPIEHRTGLSCAIRSERRLADGENDVGVVQKFAVRRDRSTRRLVLRVANPAATPAPASTSTAAFIPTSFFAPAGASATRLSPSAA